MVEIFSRQSFRQTKGHRQPHARRESVGVMLIEPRSIIGSRNNPTYEDVIIIIVNTGSG